jgi:hypothetical protein
MRLLATWCTRSELAVCALIKCSTHAVPWRRSKQGLLIISWGLAVTITTFRFLLSFSRSKGVQNGHVEDLVLQSWLVPLPLPTQSTAGTAETSRNDQTTRSECLEHPPLTLRRTNHSAKGKPGTRHEQLVLKQPTPPICGQLQRPWWEQFHVQRRNAGSLNRSRYHSSLAYEMEQHQLNCSRPELFFHLDNDFGLGSHIYLWSQALCIAFDNCSHQSPARIRTYHHPQWLWRDQAHCPASLLSPWHCYFENVEAQCPVSVPTQNISQDPRRQHQCHFRAGIDTRAWRQASIEYMFRHVSALVLNEAQRQIGLLFRTPAIESLSSTQYFGRGDNQHRLAESTERRRSPSKSTTDSAPATVAPPNLIVIHIRWGDKVRTILCA